MDVAAGTAAIAAESFVSALYEGAPGGFLCLFTVPGEHCTWFPIAEAGAIVGEALRVSESHDIYFGIGLHPEALGPKQRGEAAGVSTIPGLWVEIDIAHSCHSASALPRTLEEVTALLAEFPYPPSWIVHSGHGIHAWWLFAEPWHFDTPAEHDAAAMLERRFQRWFQEKAQERGWKIDTTADLARVLRLPGTWNRKIEGEVLPVETIHGDGSRRYHPNDFDALLPNVEEYAVRWEPKTGGKFAPVPIAPILAGCGWMRHCRDDAKKLSEPEWYGMLGILGRCQDGGGLAHQWSKPHPKYDREATEKKLVHATAAAGPRTCAAIRYDLGGEEFCSACPSWSRIRSPIVLGMSGGEPAPMPDEKDAPPERTWERPDPFATTDEEPAPFPDLSAEDLFACAGKATGEEREAFILRLAAQVAHNPLAVDTWGSRVGKSAIFTKTAFLKVVESLRRPASNGQHAPRYVNEPRELTAGRLFNDVPLPGLVIPEPYRLSAAATLIEKTDEQGEMKTTAIAYAPILLSGKLHHVAEGTESLCLCWRDGARWREKIAARGTVMDARKLVELADDGFPVASDNARDLVSYLRKLEATNQEILPSAQVSSVLGWQGKNGTLGFLWGAAHILPSGEVLTAPDVDDPTTREWRDDLIAFRGTSQGDEQIVAGFHAAGTLPAWKKALGAVVEYPLVRLAVYVSLATALLKILDCPNFVVDFAYRTTTGKTTLLRAAASVWGNPALESASAAMWTWDVTRVFVERASAVLSGVPLILDDTKRAKKPEVVADLIYTVASGRGRGRGSVKGLAFTSSWQTILMSTGEAPATSFTEDGGTRTRVIEVLDSPFGVDDLPTRQVVETLNLELALHYGHAGPAFVAWLLQNKARWPELISLYRAQAQEYATSAATPEGGRLATYAAAVYVAAKFAHDALALPWGFADPFMEIWRGVAWEAADAAGEVRALLDLHSWAHAHRDRFHGKSTVTPAQGWAGRWQSDDPFIAFFPNELREILTRLGYTPSAILRGWRERGWLETRGDRKGLTKIVRPEPMSEPTHMCVIPHSAFDSVSPSEEEEEQLIL